MSKLDRKRKRDKATREAALREARPAPQVKAQMCATEGCGNVADIHFIRGNVGSHYCASCYCKINALEQDRISALSGEAQR